MSETSMVNFRMDTELKRGMERVCKDMGLTMTTAFTMFAAKVTQERRIPFEVSADPFYSERNMAVLTARAKAVEDGSARLVNHDLIEE